MSTLTQPTALLRELEDGLVLRRSTAADADKLAEFNGIIHSDDGPEKPEERIGAWTRDLLTRPHPTTNVDDFTIVEEQATGRIVSSLNLIPQIWQYGGMIEIGVGRPELVGTLEEFRNRGLVRLQMEEVHKWSNERGHLMQAITGIPTYYRQFGYEMSMELDGGRAGFEPQVPKLKDDEKETYTLRPATEADIPFLMDVYDYGTRRSLMRCLRSESTWRYQLNGQSEKNIQRNIFHIIQEIETGEPVGYISIPANPNGSALFIWEYELKPGVSWLAVSPAVVRFLWTHGKITSEEKSQSPINAFAFWLGSEHPAYTALHENLPRVRRPYGWYTRIPDLPGFIRHIAPVIEKRLAESIAVGHTGKLRINRARSMLTLTFERGKLTGVEDSERKATDYGDLGLPGLLIHHLIFGYHSHDELHQIFPDVYVDNDQSRVLLEIIFPKQYARVLPIA